VPADNPADLVADLVCGRHEGPLHLSPDTRRVGQNIDLDGTDRNRGH
jgi:hypothetical protein